MMDAKCMRCKHNGTVICNKCDWIRHDPIFFDEFEPIETPTITPTAVNTVDSSPIMVSGTECQICDGFIPVYEYQHAYPLICNGCRKRLKKLLYGESEGE